MPGLGSAGSKKAEETQEGATTPSNSTRKGQARQAEAYICRALHLRSIMDGHAVAGVGPLQPLGGVGQHLHCLMGRGAEPSRVVGDSAMWHQALPTEP